MSATTPTAQQRPAPLFDPAEWLVLPQGGAIHRAGLRPCGRCGEPLLAYVERVEPRRPDDSHGDVGIVLSSSVQCPKCVRLKSNDRVAGFVDTRKGGRLLRLDRKTPWKEARRNA